MAKKIKIVKNGPYVVSGKVPLAKETIVTDEQGVSIKWQKNKKFPEEPEYHLCRCGHSKSKPFCDNGHVDADFDGTETASREPFAEQAEMIEGPSLILQDAPVLCASARFCDRAGGIWNLTQKSQHPDLKKIAIQEAGNCPAGRLVVSEKKGKVVEPKLKQEISLVEDPETGTSGPIWVKGRILVESSDCQAYELRNRVTLCRCGKSQNKPFCDASHISAHFSDNL